LWTLTATYVPLWNDAPRIDYLDDATEKPLWLQGTADSLTSSAGAAIRRASFFCSGVELTGRVENVPGT
jgi:hypothetical protein